MVSAAVRLCSVPSKGLFKIPVDKDGKSKNTHLQERDVSDWDI